MRVCTIHNCSYTGDRRCCEDCDKVPCRDRCQNHPSRCKCFAYEEVLQRGQKKSTVDSKKILAFAKSGMEYREIASQMNISLSAVQYHLNKHGYFRKKQVVPDG